MNGISIKAINRHILRPNIMTDTKVNQAIVKFEAALFANQPEWTTREEYAVYENWMNERKAVSNAFKAALVGNNIDAAHEIARKASAKYNIKF